MATTGAIAALRTESSHRELSVRRGRRLRLALAAVTAYVTGDRPPSVVVTVPPVRPPEAQRPLTQLERITGPLGPGSIPAPVRPRLVDKPSTLAHYRAMAEQVAHERRLADVGGRHHGADRGVGLGTAREVWFPHPGGYITNGVQRHA